MTSPHFRWQGCFSTSFVALTISIFVACVLRYRPALLLLSNWSKAVAPPELSDTGSNMNSSPDTTAVVLNWSRFANVQRIANILCTPELEGIFHTVMIWNNNPKPLSYEDFDEKIGCSPSRLRIVNSPENLYFQARFLGCMSANTTFCYTQDDDYLVLPEILESLHTRISAMDGSQAIHILPPHERLSSEVRYVCHEERGLHTTFAWLGHGAMLRRSLVQQFLASMQLVNATEEQFKMADNYFSIMLNQVPEVWYDQGIELGGGQAFTVGSEGEQRNRKHITQAGLYLDSLLEAHHDFGDHPYKCDEPPSGFIGRAPCVGRACVLETSIRTLPVLAHDVTSTADMLSNEERSLNDIPTEAQENYLAHAPSQAVDADKSTSFQSLAVGKKGDYIMVDVLLSQRATGMAWLVDEATSRLLRHCAYESSVDAKKWVVTHAHLECTKDGDDALLECVTPTPAAPARYFRARLTEDAVEKWNVYEVWLL